MLLLADDAGGGVVRFVFRCGAVRCGCQRRRFRRPAGRSTVLQPESWRRGLSQSLPQLAQCEFVFRADDVVRRRGSCDHFVTTYVDVWVCMLAR